MKTLLSSLLVGSVLLSGGMAQAGGLGGHYRTQESTRSAIDSRDKMMCDNLRDQVTHKGIILPREKKHLESLGVTPERLVETIFAVGQMYAAKDIVNVHLISEGAAVEPFLQEMGPFKDTVYAAKKEL